MACDARRADQAAMAWSRHLLGSEWEMVKRRGGDQRPIAWTHVVVNRQRIVVAMAFNEQLDGEKGSTRPTAGCVPAANSKWHSEHGACGDLPVVGS